MHEHAEQRLNRVLVVEDDDAQRRTLVDLLTNEGFDVTGCATAAEALSVTRYRTFAVAVLDLRLPDLDGTRLAEQICGQDGEIRTIIHTAYGSFDSARDAINLGVFAYVEKGGPPEALVGQVHRAMRAQYARYAHDLERAVAEQTSSLRESEHRFRAMAENSGVGIWQITSDRRTMYANPVLRDMLEVDSPAGIEGQPIVPFFTPESIATMDREHEKRARGIASMYEVEMIGRRGKRTHAIVCGAPILGEDGRLASMIGTFIDITERKREEHLRLQLEEQLRQAQKLEALGRLAGGVAHDFNNLLTVIQGNLELIRDDASQTEKIGAATRQRLEQIESAAMRAASMTSQLLAFGRRQKAAPSVINLNRVLREMSTLLQSMIGARATLDLLPDESAPRVRVDRALIEQVIMNLVVNARDALKGRGRVVVRTLGQALDEQQANAAGVAPGQYAVVEVADEGEGMPAEVLKHIFEPFFTTKDPDRGTGLGLATVYGIVKQADGHVSVASEPGRGSTFRVLLPACLEPETPREPAPQTAPDGRGEVILLCEDNRLVMDVAQRMLTARGYEVLAAASGAEALALAESSVKPIDLLLTDVRMPGMGGRELARRLRERTGSLKVLLMSGFDAELPEDEATDDYPLLHKPFRMSELVQRIRSLLND